MENITEKVVRPIFSSSQPQVVPVNKPQSQDSETKPESENNQVQDDNTPSLIPQEPFLTSPLFYEIANYFGIETPEYNHAKNKLSEIVDFAIMRAKSNKTEDILAQLRKIEEVMAPPTWGEKRYIHVYRYVRLASQRDAFNKALLAFERKQQNGNNS